MGPSLSTALPRRRYGCCTPRTATTPAPSPQSPGAADTPPFLSRNNPISPKPAVPDPIPTEPTPIKPTPAEQIHTKQTHIEPTPIEHTPPISERPETSYFLPLPPSGELNAPTASTIALTPTRDIPGFYVVIPAGGTGSRLWPLSRSANPKFLFDLTLQGQSLIKATWNRLLPLSSPERAIVVAGPEHVAAIHKELPELLFSNLLCEPSPKDTMAAIGLAAAVLVKRDPDAVIGSFAADHIISGDDAFQAAVAEAVEVAKKGHYLVTIGITPSYPSTGFGYVHVGDHLGLADAPNARLVSCFKEKPDARTAASYISDGDHQWNAGMFVMKATLLLELLKEYKPAMHEGLMKVAAVWDKSKMVRQVHMVLSEVWPFLEKIPIDNAIAEPVAAAGRVAVIPATFGWDDVGSFSSLVEILPPVGANQARILGDRSLVVADQVTGGIIVPGSGRLITCLGLDDIVIVDTPDALLVTTRLRSQEVKHLVEKVRDVGWKHLL